MFTIAIVRKLGLLIVGIILVVGGLGTCVVRDSFMIGSLILQSYSLRIQEVVVHRDGEDWMIWTVSRTGSSQSNISIAL